MIIGYSSKPKGNVFEELIFAESLGAKVFGLNLDNPENYSIKFSKLKNECKKRNIKIIVRSYHHLNTSFNSEELIKNAKKNISIAKKLGSDRIMFHPGHIINSLEIKLEDALSFKGKSRTYFIKHYNIKEKDIQNQFNQLFINLKEIVSYAKKYKIKVALENNGEKYQFGSNLKEYCLILNKVKGLYSSISTGHANVNDNNVLEYVKKCKDKIINLDLHDNNGKKDEHLPVGKGSINFKKIFNILKGKRSVTGIVDTYRDDWYEKAFENLKKLK